MLTPLADNLWDYNAPFTILGMAIGHRVTVARLADGTLWVHSPVAYTPELAVELGALGPVGHVVAPSCMHDTFLEGWFQAYPSARFHGARGFSKYRPDLKFTDQLGDTPHAAWAATFEQHMMRGIPRLNEVVFLHRASRTLILTDLAFNLGTEMPLLSRILVKAIGCYDCFAVDRLLRLAIRDRAALRTSLDKILTWDFDRLVLSHGRNVGTGAKELLRDVYAFL